MKNCKILLYPFETKIQIRIFPFLLFSYISSQIYQNFYICDKFKLYNLSFFNEYLII